MADTNTIRVPVAGPPVRPRRFGLLDVVTPVDPDSPHWRVGVTWDGSVGCGNTTSTTGDACLTGETPSPLSFTNGCRARRTAAAVTVYTRQRRSLLSDDTAVEAFDASEARTVEDEFWTAVLADNATTDLGVTWPTLLDALAAVEQGIADDYNGLGLILMPPREAVLLGKHLAATDSGLFTVLGTPVAVGIGFDADGDDSVIVGIGAPLIMRGPVETVPANSPSINDAETLVQRTWVLGWDCVAVSAGSPAPALVTEP